MKKLGLKIPRLPLILFFVFFFCKPSLAANCYIRAGATGSNSGSSWANAWTTFGAVTWTRGNTYYVAGGTYNEDVTITAAEAGTNWIIIKKANAGDNSGDPGWDSSFAAAQAVVNGKFVIYNGYFEMDGVTGSGLAGHGIKISVISSASVLAFSSGASPRHLHHLDLQGPGFDYGSAGTDGIYYNSTAANSKGLYISYCWIHEIPRNGVTVGNVVGTDYINYGMLFENNVLGRTGGVAIAYPGIHGQGMQIAYSQADAYVIIRNNIFYNIYSQGPISYLGLGTHSNSRIYNNVFYSTDPAAYSSASAIYMHNLSVSVADIYVYNNTFYNLGGYASHIRNDFAGAPNIEVKNNLWVSCPFGQRHTNITAAANNDYYNNYGVNIPAGETNQKTETADPFINSAGYDLHLKPGANARDSGIDLSGIFTTDKDGVTRPPGFWDIGAYEYGGSITPPPPPPPDTGSSIFNNTKTYPSPYKLEAGKTLKIIELPLNANVKIYNMNGVLIKELKETDFNNAGYVEWDGKDNNNDPVARGIYYYVASDEKGNKKTGKFTVLK